MHLINITAANAKTPEQFNLTKRFGVIWLFSEDGQNWYEAQKHFALDTLKVAYNNMGIIGYIGTDVSAFDPSGLSVVELPNITANRRADASGAWMYRDGQVIKRIYTHEELVAQADEKKARLLSDAAAVITPLERAVKHGMATDDERARLEAWERYSVLLSRIDTADAPDIAWPPAPEV